MHMDPNTLRDVIYSRLSRLLLGYPDVVPLQAIAVRPVQGVSLSLISGHGYRALEVLARTSMPFLRLTIVIVDTSAQN